MMLQQPSVLGQAPLATQRQPGTRGEGLLTEHRSQISDLELVAPIMPGDHRRDRLTPSV